MHEDEFILYGVTLSKIAKAVLLPTVIGHKVPHNKLQNRYDKQLQKVERCSKRFEEARNVETKAPFIENSRSWMRLRTKLINTKK
jgi:predicted ABC-type ATPase